MRPDEAHVHAEAIPQRTAHVRAERIVADSGDHGSAATQARGRDCDVRRATADRLCERLDVCKAHTLLAGVEVDAHTSDSDQLEAQGELIFADIGASQRAELM